METALCLSYSQIVEGGADCSYCDAPAAVVVSTGADPDPDPMCWPHACQFIDTNRAIGDRLFSVAA